MGSQRSHVFHCEKKFYARSKYTRHKCKTVEATCGYITGTVVEGCKGVNVRTWWRSWSMGMGVLLSDRRTCANSSTLIWEKYFGSVMGIPVGSGGRSTAHAVRYMSKCTWFTFLHCLGGERRRSSLEHLSLDRGNCRERLCSKLQNDQVALHWNNRNLALQQPFFSTGSQHLLSRCQP